jgi:GNAT superfamily N-acetyltransferase
MPGTRPPLQTPIPRDGVPARFGRTWEEVVSLADQHTLAVQFWLPTRAPDAAVFRGMGTLAGSSGLPIPLLNQALGSQYPTGADARVIDDEIEAVKAFFDGRGVPWYWWLGPNSHPPDFGQRLEQHGLVFDPPTLPALAARLPARLPPITPDAHVWLASERADLEAASAIRRIVFRFPEGAAQDYFEMMADDWLRGDPARLYLARLGDGPPAAIGALIVAEGCPGVYVMATLPEWTRKGLGKAILTRILLDAASDGHSLIALTASSQGYPLYRQFGFEHIFDYHIYRLAGEV